MLRHSTPERQDMPGCTGVAVIHYEPVQGGVEHLGRLWSLPTGPGRADSDRESTRPHPVTSECMLCGRWEWTSSSRALVGNETHHVPFLVQRTVPPCLSPEGQKGLYSAPKDPPAPCRPHRDGVAWHLRQSSAPGGEYLLTSQDCVQLCKVRSPENMFQNCIISDHSRKAFRNVSLCNIFLGF